MEDKRALIAMSGGVDSAVAAYCMRQAGYDCLGVTMQLFSADTPGMDTHGCCSQQDIADARHVAEQLGIPHEVCRFPEQFSAAVMEPFVAAYLAGQTPNPCVECNRRLKFGRLFEEAKRRGCDKVATGHYARVIYDAAAGRYRLLCATDPGKDQSYVLYTLTQEQLAHVAFPLGEMHKADVRALASACGFSNADKPDSQDICFVKDGSYADFIEAYTGQACPHGNFVTAEGQVLGEHRGIIRYTIGQRKGLGLSLPAPLYVCAIRSETNEVVLGPEEALFSSVFYAHRINLIAVERLTEPRHLMARIRYRQAAQPACVTQEDEDTLRVVFDRPQRAITPGQTVVLYDGDEVVGGGIIAG